MDCHVIHNKVDDIPQIEWSYGLAVSLIRGGFCQSTICNFLSLAFGLVLNCALHIE